MTYSYSQPIAGIFPTLKDEVRFLAQDTVESDASISDEEIAYLLETYDNQVYITASQVAATLAMRYGKEAAITSRSVGDLSISAQYAETAKWYQGLASKLKLGKQDNSASAFFIDTARQFAIGQFDELRP